MSRLLIAAGTLLLASTADAQEAARIRAMAELPSTYGAVYSPDGKRIAFLSSRSGTPQVWLVDGPNAGKGGKGSEPRQITQSTDPIGALAWSPIADTIAYDVARGGGFNAQVFLSRADGSDAKRITSGGKEDNFAGGFAPDGRYWFRSNVRKPEAPDSWIHDPRTGESKLAIEYAGLGGINDIQRPGNRALISRVVTRGNTNLFLHDLATGKETLLTAHEGPAIVYGELAPDGSAAYIVNNLGRDRLAIGRIAIDPAGQPGPMTTLAAREDAEAESFVISADGRRAVLIWNVGGRSELELVTLPSGKRVPLPPPPGEIVSVSDITRGGERIALNISGATRPPSAWQYEVATRRYTQIAPLATPGFEPSALVTPQLRKYPAHDGLELSGWLYLPRDFKQPGPVVLSFHGGPEGQERPTFRADYQAILAQGIAVFAPNIRGSAGFGKAFLAMDDREKRFDANRDILSSANYLLEAGIGARGRLGIVGGSYGGYVVMVGVTEYPTTFAAGANLFGIVNFETFFSQSTPWMGAMSSGEYGDPKTQAELLKQLSPIHKLDRIQAAMLVMHGANDTNVPLVEAQQVVDTLQKNGRPAEFLLFPDEGHGWRKIPNRVKSTLTMAEFFKRHLLREPG